MIKFFKNEIIKIAQEEGVIKKRYSYIDNEFKIVSYLTYEEYLEDKKYNVQHEDEIYVTKINNFKL